MDLKPEDDTLILHIRSSVRKWQAEPKEKQEEYLNIPEEESGIPHLSRYQVRLTHQIVRNDYPNLKTTGMGHFVQITNPTEQQQASQKLALVESREKDIARAVGFRWLIEGITGGNILNIPDEYIVAGLPTIQLKGRSPKEFLQTLQQKLKARPRILVGHNCFTDFVNLYKCFIGPLPNTVERLASDIHDLFPGVIDTKSLASFGHKRWGNTSLEDVELDLRSQEKPRIHVPTEYDRYTYASRYHEAGYDSLLTAKIAIKLSAKLERDQEYVTKLKQTDNGREIIESFGADEDEFHEITAEFVENETKDGSGTPESDLPPADESKAAPKPPDETQELVAVKGLIDIRSNKEDVDEILEAEGVGSGFGKGGDSGSVSGSDGGLQKLGSDLLKMQEKGDIMPMWGNKVFWALFGNKLQVNGSKEGVCKLE